MSIDVRQYKQAFIDEARDHLDAITQALLILEKDQKNSEALNAIFRAAHTLKGSSGMMGYKDISELTHAMEDVFDNLRKGGQVSSGLIDVLLNCVDSLTERLNRIQNDEEGEINIAPLISRLNEAARLAFSLADQKAMKESELPKEQGLNLSETEINDVEDALNNGLGCFVVDVKLCDDCVFKSIRANMVLDRLADRGNIIKTVPDKEEIAQDKISSNLKIIFASKLDKGEVEKLAHSVSEVEKVSVSPFDLKSIKAKSENAPKRAVSPTDELKSVLDTRLTQSVRVHFDQLDKLINLVGELVINKIALLQICAEIKNESLKRVSANIDRLTAELHDLVMQIRMVPVSQIFDRFPRLVRDLSVKRGKKVEIIMEGKEIEVDRTVLDEIGQPLVHLIRNCIDHGIEEPEERIKRGKNPTGIIRMRAQRRGDNVIIEVEDDGAGIDTEKVKEAAISKGFITEAEAEKMGKEQLVNLIFLSGLSTAKEVTETSGRGVGMDVVKSKIAALGGTVHVETELGKGTKVTLRLPSTLAIIKSLLIKVFEQTFAVPTGQIFEVIRINKKDIRSLGHVNAILFRDKVIPIVYLHDLLNLPKNDNAEFYEVLIVHGENENEKLGLVVDSVIRQQEILVKSLDETLSSMKGISGATILGDGQVVVVLDVGNLINNGMGKTNGLDEYSPILAN
ncbi:MAG: chemotaxis protein CheA [Candidatus Bathyarchaeia archaeon]